VVALADRIAYVSHDFTDAVRAGILSPDDLPAEIADVVGRSQSRQIGAFVTAVFEAIDRTGHVGMTEPAATALARFRAFNFDRIYLRPAACQQAEKVVGLLRGLVDFFVDAPTRMPADATDMHAGLVAGSAETAAVAVRYVSGMTDRYALGLGVELLGWRSEHLPRGV
jgi:dGTPase